jgi:hypothetical protein
VGPTFVSFVSFVVKESITGLTVARSARGLFHLRFAA